MPDLGVDTLISVSTSVGEEDFTRVTVISPTRRIDLALPSSAALGELLPTIVRFSGHEPGTVQESVHTWVLQRAGDDPLDPNKLVSALSIRDGEILHLRQRGAVMPDAAFDDVVDAVATATSTVPAWTAKHSRRFSLAMLVLVAAGVPLGLLLERMVASGGALSDPVGGAIALGVAVATGIAAIVMSRAFGRHAVAATLGWTAVGLAGLGAFFVVPTVPQPQVAALVACSAVLAMSATIGLAARVHPYGMLATVLTSFFSLVVTMLMALLPTRVVEVAAVAVAVMLVLTAALPQISYQVAQIAMPVLPTGAEQLMADDQPIQSDIVTRAIMADRLLASFLTATAATTTIFLVPVVGRGGWADLSFAGAVSLALLLRARAFVGLYQRIVLLVGGVVASVLTLVEFAAQAPTGILTLLIGSAAVVLGASLLVLYASRMYDRILSPSWGRFGDIFEWIAIMAIIPLLLAVLNVYAFMLGLGG
jgi:type VII secretion integral membrane protein EccD